MSASPPVTSDAPVSSSTRSSPSRPTRPRSWRRWRGAGSSRPSPAPPGERSRCSRRRRIASRRRTARRRWAARAGDHPRVDALRPDARGALADRAVALADGAPPEVRAVADVASAVVHSFSGDPRDPSAESVALLAASRDPAALMWVFGQAQIWMFMERYAEAGPGSTLVNVAREQAPLPCCPFRSTRARSGGARPAGRGRRRRDGRSAQRGYRAAVERRSGSMVLALIDALRDGPPIAGARAGMLALKGPSEAESLSMLLEPGAGLPRPGRGRPRRGGPSPRCRRPPPSGDRRRPPAHRLLRAGPHRGSDPPRPVEEAEARRDVRRPGRACGAPWPAAAAARCRGLLADDDAFEDHFAEALACTPGRPRPSSGRAPSCARASGGGARRAREAASH